MVKIELKNVSFIQKKIHILSEINLTIEDREYAIIVGPTGAGKTSLIGIISGLYRPTSGQVLFDGKDITELPPNERHCGVQFESYALFPHLTVIDNVSFARHMKESNHEETHLIASEILNMVRLSGRGKSLPNECSGGMQQRVALARALMALEESGLLILDEPFKALDAGLRMNLRREVKKIAKSDQLKLTTIHITNDMQEAMLADKIIVLDQGKIRQVGSPGEVMYSPTDIFVANFFSTEFNYFNGKIIKIEEVPVKGFKNLPLTKIIIQSDEGYYLYAKTERNFTIGEEVTLVIRSQYIKARHKKREDKTNNIVGVVKKVKFMGAWLRIELEAPYKYENFPDSNNQATTLQERDSNVVIEPPKKIIKIELPTTKLATHNFVEGETITVFYPSEYAIVFPKIDEKLLLETIKVK
jgi:iron(III) transport system ATP-binding protein